MDLSVGREAERVRGADRARGCARAVGDAQRGRFVRDRHVRADESGLRKRAYGLVEELGRDREPLVAEPLQAERGERGLVHRRRAAVSDRPAEDAETAGAHYFCFFLFALCEFEVLAPVFAGVAPPLPLQRPGKAPWLAFTAALKAATSRLKVTMLLAKASAPQV